MFNINTLKSTLTERMEKAEAHYHKELSGLRTGRASVNLLDPIMVNAYGSMTPINQVASLSAPEPRMISVSVWDKGMANAVEKAIRESELGLNPQMDGTLIRIPLPPLNEERRKELVKVAGKYAEETRNSIRGIRREGMEELKSAEKSKEISEDEQKKYSEDIQKLTDSFIAKIDEHLKAKEKDILEV